MKIRTIRPASTKEERTKQYVNALLECDDKYWTINAIGLQGSIWNNITRKLREAKMIERTRMYTPRQYRLIKTKVQLKAWLDEVI